MTHMTDSYNQTDLWPWTQEACRHFSQEGIWTHSCNRNLKRKNQHWWCCVVRYFTPFVNQIEWAKESLLLPNGLSSRPSVTNTWKGSSTHDPRQQLLESFGISSVDPRSSKCLRVGDEIRALLEKDNNNFTTLRRLRRNPKPFGFWLLGSFPCLKRPRICDYMKTPSVSKNEVIVVARRNQSVELYPLCLPCEDAPLLSNIGRLNHSNALGLGLNNPPVSQGRMPVLFFLCSNAGPHRPESWRHEKARCTSSWFSCTTVDFATELEAVSLKSTGLCKACEALGQLGEPQYFKML